MKRQPDVRYRIMHENDFIKLYHFVNYPKNKHHEIEYEVISRHIICLVMKVKHVKCTGTIDRQKRCTRCECYFSIPEMNCPCCNLRVRTMQHAKAQNKAAGLEREQHEIG